MLVVVNFVKRAQVKLLGCVCQARYHILGVICLDLLDKLGHVRTSPALYIEPGIKLVKSLFSTSPSSGVLHNAESVWDTRNAKNEVRQS